MMKKAPTCLKDNQLIWWCVKFLTESCLQSRSSWEEAISPLSETKLTQSQILNSFTQARNHTSFTQRGITPASHCHETTEKINISESVRLHTVL